MDAQHSRKQADRCKRLAEATPSARLKELLTAEAAAWNALAEDQEWTEQRDAEREAQDAFASAAIPALRAILAACTPPPPSQRVG